jgi:nucleoside-diphosphate-sugar epimerase
MRVLVTGANGFIGRHIVRCIEKQGDKINVLVRNSNSFNISDKVNIFEGDIFDNEKLRKAVNEVDAVFHLVAKTHDSSSIDNAKDYYKINVEGTRNLLDACINSNIKHFVYFSSVKAMVEESKYTLDETYDCTPTTLYGETKLMAERLVIEYGSKYDFKTTILRLPLVYGPGNKGNIYKMIEAIDNGRFVMLGNGSNKRSMVYVGNVADAGIAVIDRKVADTKVYVITDGVNYTVKDLYKLIAKGLSKKPLPFYVPMGIAKMLAIAGDIASRITGKSLPFNSDVLNKLTSSLAFSSQKIQNEIGFRPKHNLYNTIDETIKWYKNRES